MNFRKQSTIDPVITGTVIMIFPPGLSIVPTCFKNASLEGYRFALILLSKNRTENDKVEQDVLSQLSFGGGCINDTIIHLATPYLGFGGVGNSGMGSYHGKKSFDIFTHEKSIIKKSDKIDIPVRYMPYNKAKEQLMKFFLKL